ncbi:MAG: MarR family winged helix-turn-helix transcriptional regulator [Magnetospiraceae bacterium]
MTVQRQSALDGTEGFQPQDFSLKEFFPYLVRIYYRAVSDAVREVYSKSHQLSVNEWRSMVVLNNFEPLSAKEIVTRSSLDKVNVSRAIARLQERQFLERHVDPSDRRRVLLRLTAKGKKAMAYLVPRVREVEQRLLEGLTESERETLLDLMARVQSNANAIIAENGARTAGEDD